MIVGDVLISLECIGSSLEECLVREAFLGELRRCALLLLLQGGLHGVGRHRLPVVGELSTLAATALAVVVGESFVLAETGSF